MPRCIDTDPRSAKRIPHVNKLLHKTPGDRLSRTTGQRLIADGIILFKLLPFAHSKKFLLREKNAVAALTALSPWLRFFLAMRSMSDEK